MEGQRLIYTPLWVRVLALGSLVAALGMSAVVVVIFIDSDREAWVLAALSVTQVAASGLFISFLLLFSARDNGVLGLRLKTARLLRRELPAALSQIRTQMPPPLDWQSLSVSPRAMRVAMRTGRTPVAVSHPLAANAAKYRVAVGTDTLLMRVQVNVREVTVSYYFPAASEAEMPALQEALTWALSRYVKIGGYTVSWYFSAEAFDGKTYASAHLTRDFDRGFLDQDYDKLYFVQDVAASTASLIKDCGLRGIALSHPEG